jgi:C4-dicarboxylate transporter, DctM subunit
VNPFVIGLCGIALVIVLLAIRIPIAFALAIAGTIGIILLSGFQTAMESLGTYPFGFLKSWVMVAIPLFVLMGSFANLAGVSAHAYDTANKWLSRFPGGLAMATIAGCAAFAATSGSSVATAGVMGATAIPEMKKQGYDLKLATGCVAAGGLLGILIPPSIVMVIYASLTNISLSKMLLAGFLPGILTAMVFMIGIVLMVVKQPSLAPRSPSFTWKERFLSLPKIWSTVVLFMTVILTIYLGILTPTEAAAAGAMMAFIMALVKHIARPLELLRGLSEASRTTVMILALCMGASIFTQFLSLTGLPTIVSQYVINIQINRWMILIICMLLYIPLGMFLDTISILLITIPIVFPVVQSLGFDPIWFGILVVKLEEVSLITPPVGLNVFVIKGIVPEVPLETIFKGIYPFLIMEFIVIVILMLFPDISLWLPAMMLGK